MATEDDSDDGKKWVRSPKYPTISLEAAVARARAFYDKERRNTVPVPIAVKHWGYQPKSSGGLKTVAALINFGLMGDKGSSDERKVFLTDAAMRILLDNRAESPDRLKLIQDAALKPKIYSDILASYPDGLPSDETLQHFLIFEKDFNTESVRGFLKDFRATLAYAKLADSGNFEALPENIDENQMQQPATPERKPPQAPGQPIVLSELLSPSVLEREWMRGKLPQDKSYRIMVSGDLGPKDINKLIRLLEAQRDVLTDDEEDPLS